MADHARWAARFKAVRLLHVLEVDADTIDVEMKLEGTGPWSVGHDIDVIFTPGHTEVRDSSTSNFSESRGRLGVGWQDAVSIS